MKENSALLVLTLVAFQLALSHVSAQSSFSQNEKGVTQCQLKVGWGDWPPYQFSGLDSRPQGIQIDLLGKIANEAKCELNYVQQTFTENQRAVELGIIDLTLDSTITESRKKFAHFSTPYRNEVLVLYARPKYIEDCQTKPLSQLINEGLRLGLTIGNIYGDLVTELQRNPQLNDKLVYQSRNSLHFKALSEHKLDAVLEDPAVMAYQIRRNQSIGVLKSCKVAVQSSPVSLMFSKKTVSPAILTRFNEALDRVKKTDYYMANWSW